MNISKIILFLLMPFICISCHPKWVASLKEKGKMQPIKKAYKLSRKPFVYSNLIDTNAVYINELELVNTDGSNPHIYYRFIRFSGNGLVRSQILFDKPTESDFNSGQICFYHVEGSSIKLEKYNHDLEDFEYWYGRINEDGIYFAKRKKRELFGGIVWEKALYRKHEANFTQPIVFPGK
ncbi:MAG: hypothetical protein EOP00_33645 [Pedobacter sp.]|nr:MAG: hypothetical protein EOP00_33645 [Pedobacter sp.]